MPVVYRLSTQLEIEPERIELARSLTLDPERPHMGLKGALGLFATPEWWENIRLGVMRLERRTGIIQRLFRVGQDSGAEPNMFEMIGDDGEIFQESIYANHAADRGLFKPGRRVEILYALDELKRTNVDGSKCYSQTVIEMAVSANS